MDKILMAQVGVDWLTATSFSQSFFNAASRILGTLETAGPFERYEAELMQYKGMGYFNVDRKRMAFLGKGMQKCELHTMLRVSGYTADEVFRRLMQEEKLRFSVSRLDLQLTFPAEGELSANLWRDFHEKQHAHESGRGTRKRGVTLISNNEEGNTLYVGSRRSERFVRVYEKSIESGASSSSVRLESELKGRVPDRVVEECRADGIDETLVNVLNSISEGLVDHSLIEMHKKFLLAAASGSIPLGGRIATTPSSSLLWFGEACLGVADRLLACEETRETFIHYVDELSDKCLEHKEV